MHSSHNKLNLYVGKRRKTLEFEAGEHGILSVTPTIGIGKAIKLRKLTPKFIKLYQITRRIGPTTYEIPLSQHRTNLLNGFHVSLLRKYVASPMHVLEKDDV